jgi:amino acid transporter
MAWTPQLRNDTFQPMLTRVDDAEPPTEVGSRQGRLQQDAVGVVGIVFFVVAAAAPLAAVVGAAPIIFGATDNTGAAGAFALTGIVLLLFSVGYAAMSRYVSGPSGFSVYVGRAFGARAGVSASLVAILGYAGFQLGNCGLFGFLAESLFADKLSVHLSWWVWSLLALAATAALGYRDVALSSKVLGLLMIFEVAIILVLDLATLGQGGESGVTLSAFEPARVFEGAAGITIMLAFASFVGFEATTIYGEEARDRHRTVPRATYIAVILVAAFYVFSYWAFQVGYGDAGAAAKGAEDPGNFVFDLSTRYVGSLSTDIMHWLVLTSLFAVVLSFHNALSRYLFALGRGGVLPTRLSWTHPTHQSPVVASATQSVIAVVVIGIFAIAGGDPYLELYAWFVGVGAVAVLALYATSAVSVVRFLRRESDETPWTSIVAPVLAAGGLGAAVYLAVHNFSTLTASTSDLINRLWLLVPAVAVIGFVLSRGGPSRSLHAGESSSHGHAERSAP